jgi:hypothetical protein
MTISRQTTFASFDVSNSVEFQINVTDFQVSHAEVVINAKR